MPTQVTVFGGAGYLGRRIVRQLEALGARRIRIAVRHPAAAEALTERKGVEAVEADITDPETVRRALDGSDAAVNAVSLYVQTASLDFDDIHVDGAANVAVAAQKAGAALAHISGVGADPGSSQRYIRSRGRGEEAVRAAHDAAIILRPTVLFSAHGGLTEQILRVLRRTPVFPLFGRGETRLQPVHRDDVAMAAARLLERKDIRLCECGGAEVKPYRAIVEQIAEAAGLYPLLLPFSFPAWRAVALVAEWLPGAPLTRDQVALMREDMIADERLAGLADLGIAPRALSEALQERFDPALTRS